MEFEQGSRSLSKGMIQCTKYLLYYGVVGTRETDAVVEFGSRVDYRDGHGRHLEVS